MGLVHTAKLKPALSIAAYHPNSRPIICSWLDKTFFDCNWPTIPFFSSFTCFFSMRTPITLSPCSLRNKGVLSSGDDVQKGCSLCYSALQEMLVFLSGAIDNYRLLFRLSLKWSMLPPRSVNFCHWPFFRTNNSLAFSFSFPFSLFIYYHFAFCLCTG